MSWNYVKHMCVVHNQLHYLFNDYHMKFEMPTEKQCTNIINSISNQYTPIQLTDNHINALSLIDAQPNGFRQIRI